MASAIFTWIATAIALTGTILNCKQIRACFYLWIVTNAMWFCWDASCGLLSRCLLDAVQFVLAIYGVYEWRKLEATRAESTDE